MIKLEETVFEEAYFGVTECFCLSYLCAQKAIMARLASNLSHAFSCLRRLCDDDGYYSSSRLYPPDMDY